MARLLYVLFNSLILRSDGYVNSLYSFYEMSVKLVLRMNIVIS